MTEATNARKAEIVTSAVLYVDQLTKELTSQDAAEVLQRASDRLARYAQNIGQVANGSGVRRG